MHEVKKKKVKKDKIHSGKEISLEFDAPPSHPRGRLGHQFPLSFKGNLRISEFAGELYVPLKTQFGVDRILALSYGPWSVSDLPKS